MRIFFALSHIGFYRNFELTVHELRRLGCTVQLATSKKHKTITPADYGVLDEDVLQLKLRGTKTYQDFENIQKRRVARDVLFYANKRFRNAEHLVNRFVSQQKKGTITEHEFQKKLRRLRRLPTWALDLLDRRHQKIEDGTPPHPNAIQILQEFKPDLLVASPLVHFSTQETELVKAARHLGIRSFYPVASWDNLTNKGRLKTMPDSVAVWNDAMAEEALAHGVQAGRLHVTGAPVFDWWFDFTDVWSRDEFLTRAGQPAASGPIIAYLCSSDSIGGGTEEAVIGQWANEVRRSNNPALRQAHLIVRPHPMKGSPIQTAAEYTVFPSASKHPSGDEQKSIFYNTIYHADAIVGLNTSAMIEAAIMGKPVLTFRGHASDFSQAANLHFRHLSGFVKTSDSLAAHIAELEETLNNPSRTAAATKEFVRRFVRPQGLERSASVILADLIMREAKLSSSITGHH